MQNKPDTQTDLSQYLDTSSIFFLIKKKCPSQANIKPHNIKGIWTLFSFLNDQIKRYEALYVN